MFAFLGVPYFTVEPQDASVSPNAPFHMACAAVGPPEPVTIVWWMGDSRVGLPDISPSILNVSGKTACSVKSAERKSGERFLLLTHSKVCSDTG